MDVSPSPKPPFVIIAVDGPAASGKGTIARALARHYGLPHLDTGLLYRAVGVAMRRADLDPADADAAADIAGRFPDDLLQDADLRSRDAGNLASIVSAHPGVRAALLARQRSFAARSGGAVLDGRDIGTVIAPNADAKLYVTADVRERARRRARELAGVDVAVIEADLIARDERDTARAAAPLAIASDAFVLDTTCLGVEEAIDAALKAVEAARA